MPNINTLTPELIDLIITHLHDLKFLNPAVPFTPDIAISFLPKDEKLSRYCTISRTWQFAVERYTFAHIVAYSDELPRLKSVVGACPRRIQLVRVLRYYVNLPGYSERRKHLVETRSEHEANLETFRREVVELWILLKSWEGDASPGGIQLVLSAVVRGETKNTFADDEEKEEYIPVHGRHFAHMSRGIGADRWARKDHSLTFFNDFGDAPDLPALSCVTGFTVTSVSRRIHPVAIHQMLLTLPRLKDLNITIRPVKPKRKALRAEMRNALARALGAPTLYSLESLNLDLDETTPENHDFETTTERDPDFPNGDNLCRAICKLAQTTLKSLEITSACFISPVLFGIDPSHPERETAPFPKLENFIVEIAHVTYDGRWYFTGNRDEAIVDEYDEWLEEELLELDWNSEQDSDSDPNADANSAHTAPSEDLEEIEEPQDREALQNGTFPYRSYRRTPDLPLFNPLFHALIHAAQRMPNLQEAIVSTNNRGDDDYGVQFHFFAPGQLVESLVEPGVNLRSTNRTWRVLPEDEMKWEVPGEIRGMMEEHVGVGGEVVVGWGDVDRVND
ncbi:uncharacterized protein BDV14DRAFT_197224 [Aspergillus stella-maris]|uniref:uncharacterized protein n=1 Tax=Aspergillus stella-maris TaxID=1810926 RepID=UPI003CCE2F50